MGKIITRRAEDDFHAMQIAQGMENAGAKVFSIANNGNSTYPGAISPHCRFVVFAKIKTAKMIDKVDAEIEKEIRR